jgi:hypothetical protein
MKMSMAMAGFSQGVGRYASYDERTCASTAQELCV